MKLLIFFLLILAVGCATRKEFPYQLEDWMNSRLPYDENIFNCRHRASYAEGVLKENGYTVFKKTGERNNRNHVYLVAFKDGERYEILK